MKNLTAELVRKAKTAKSPEELFDLAKANNVEMTEEEAKTYFAQLNANGVVADDDLNAVAGGLFGLSCPGGDGEDADEKTTSGLIKYKKCSSCNRVIDPESSSCPGCGAAFRFI